MNQKLDRILHLLEEKTGNCKEVVNTNEDKEAKEKGLVCFTNEKLENIVAKTELTQEDYRTAHENGLDAHTPFGKQFDDFLVIYPKGKFTWKDFAGDWAHSMGWETVMTRKLGEHLLRIYDSDRDCLSDFTEYMLTQNIFNYGSADEVFAQIFRAFDVDADGLASYKEVERILKAMSIPIHEKFRYAVDDEFVKNSFDQMDKNNDGNVSKEEFLKPITRKDHFRSCFIDIIFKMLFGGPGAGPRGSELGLL